MTIEHPSSLDTGEKEMSGTKNALPEMIHTLHKP